MFKEDVELRPIVEIPKEILQIIFEFLTPKDLFNILLVNKKFHESANDEYLWKQYCENILKSKAKILKSWKEQFKLFYGMNNYPMIKCGNNHSLILLENGTLFACGFNNYGKMGFGNIGQKISTFQKVPFDKKIIQIGAGMYNTFLLTDDLHLYSCGRNEAGNLGLGDKKKIIQISCGPHHSCALTDDGFVYSWGSNWYGGLGHRDGYKPKFIPTLIEGLTKIKKVYCGADHTIAINENDEMYIWGGNLKGELGLGDERCFSRITPTLNSFFQKRKIKKIACGFHHCLVLLENGEVYSWGDNEYGQLGHGDWKNKCTPTLISFFKEMKVINIFAFYNQSIVLLENFDIYAFGANKEYQLGLNDRRDRAVPEKIPYLKNEKIIHTEGGFGHTFFITEDKKIYGVGNKNEGQLGIDDKFAFDVCVPKCIKSVNLH